MWQPASTSSGPGVASYTFSVAAFEISGGQANSGKVSSAICSCLHPKACTHWHRPSRRPNNSQPSCHRCQPCCPPTSEADYGLPHQLTTKNVHSRKGMMSFNNSNTQRNMRHYKFRQLTKRPDAGTKTLQVQATNKTQTIKIS